MTAARTEFAVHGFAATSLRAVARRASVDPALVHHYFRDKSDLADAAILPAGAIDSFVGPVLAAAPGETGVALVEGLVRAWEDPAFSEALLASMRIGIGDVNQAGLLRTLLLDGPIASALRERGATEVGVATAMSHLVGMMAARYVIGLEPLASMPIEAVVASHGPVVQECLDLPAVVAKSA